MPIIIRPRERGRGRPLSTVHRSDLFIGTNLRKGRGKVKESRQQKSQMTVILLEETKNKVSEMSGNGYGSAVVDLAIRLLYELVTTGENLAEEVIFLKRSCTSPYLINNIERLERMIKV